MWQFPTISLALHKCTDLLTYLSALIRLEKRKRAAVEQSNNGIVEVPDIGSEVDLSEPKKTEITLIATEDSHNISCRRSGQLLTDQNSCFSVNDYRDDDRAMLYYTEFNDFGHLCSFFNILGSAVYHLNYTSSLLDPADQVFLTLTSCTCIWRHQTEF